MRRRTGLALALLLALTGTGPAASGEPAALLDDGQLMDNLIAAYPDYLQRREGNEIIWKDGTRMPFDDGRTGKPFAAMLDAPSIKDMFYAPYTPGAPVGQPALDIDPGRVRYEPFFIKMYGDCRTGETAKAMADVVWLPKKWGQKVRVSRINGVAEQLAKVSAELDELPARFDGYLFPPAGTLNCRVIAGTNRLSAHGSATAIDIATRHAHYWQWNKPGPDGRYTWHNEIPQEIVDIFERHGFIWGGKWYHFDTMHFEYRPELIAAGKATAPAKGPAGAY